MGQSPQQRLLIGNIPPWLLGSLALLIVALLHYYLKWWKNLLQTPELLLGIGAGAAHYVLSSLTLITFRGWYLVTEVLAIVLFYLICGKGTKSSKPLA